MGDVAYRSQVHTERAVRFGTPPCRPRTHRWWFGVHSEVASHYGLREGQYQPHATTLDYVVAAAAG
jgi:hypothetical protein